MISMVCSTCQERISSKEYMSSLQERYLKKGGVRHWQHAVSRLLNEGICCWQDRDIRYGCDLSVQASTIFEHVGGVHRQSMDETVR